MDPGWKKNGWRTADKKPVKNVDLWQRLEQAARGTRSSGTGSRAMHGHVGNERADELARGGMAPFLPARKRANGGALMPAARSPLPP